MDDNFYHFVTTNFNNYSKKNKVILAGNWCIEKFSDKKNLDKNIILIENIWHDLKKLEEDYFFIKNLLNIYSKKICIYLNQYHNLNKTQKYWDILILPWLLYYLSSTLYRWRVFEKALTISNKKIIFDDYKNISNIKIDTTIDFSNYAENSEKFNYILFRKIVFFFKKDINIKLVSSENNLKHFDDKKNTLFTGKIYHFYLSCLDEINIFLSRNSNIFIEQNLFSFSFFIKLNLKLRQFPHRFKYLFNYKLENQNLNKIYYNYAKREKIELDKSKKNNIDVSYQNFLNENIRFDIPLCFLEGYRKIEDSNKNIKMNPKIILSCYHYWHNERFKFWSANQVTSNNSCLYIAEHGGGEQLKYNGGLRISDHIGDKKIKFASPKKKNDFQLPAPNYNFNFKRKNQIYLSYQESRRRQFPNKVGSNMFNNYGDLENILLLKEQLADEIFKFFKYIPGVKSINSETSDIKKLLGEKYVNKINLLKKFIPISKIVICSTAETSFTESLLSGPTIFINNNNLNSFNEDKGIMEQFMRCQIVFDNAKEAAEHINAIWNNPYEWWHSKAVEEAVEKYKSEFTCIKENPLEIWYKFLKHDTK